MPKRGLENGVTFKTGKWLKEEEEIMKNNAREYLQMNNQTLSGIFQLSSKDRRPFFKHCCQNINRKYPNVWKKAMRMFDEKNHLGSYTQQEIKLLKKLSKTIKDEHKWKIIGEKMGRSAMSVRDRMTKIGLESKNKRKRAWTKQEKDRFKAAVEKYGHDWQSVSEEVETRTARQCLKYSVDQRNSANRGEVLSIRDQVTMVELLSREPVNYTEDIDWNKISATFPGGRSNPAITALNLKRRFKKLVLYRIPFHHQLGFNETIDVLMENFVKPFKEGKLEYGNEKWLDKRKKKEGAGNQNVKREILTEEDSESVHSIEDDDENQDESSTENDDVTVNLKREILTLSDDDD